jgi:predicted AlkP superfamily pyrophosphatase or phosphodiesterase
MALFSGARAENAAGDVRLVLQITVDGLRGDLLRRYRHRFGDGGFRMLLETGAVFTNTHYSHANTETIVGHTTLATGAHPSEHGMVGNVIFDRESGELAYNLEDPDSPMLATRDVERDGAQVDPSQQRSRSQGRSPRNILASTLADELSVFHAGQPKVFGVSGKDRSAIAMAGHVGKAFWYSTDTGDFQTSAYYYDAYPAWVKAWNDARRAESYSGASWELSGDSSLYLMGDRDDRPYETDLKGYGRTFPHPFGTFEDKLFATRLLVSPIGDQLTADFAKTLIDSENLGQDDIPDYLSVSFSGVDAINHFFGPSSLENEEIVLQLDRTLAGLFAHIDQAIGLDKTLIVLSADHGMPEAPEFMSELGMNAERIDPKEISDLADRVGRETFSTDGLVLAFFRPYLYLDNKAITQAGLDQAEVERAIAAELEKMPGIAAAVSTKALPSLQDTPLIRSIRRNTHAQRSGDIYVVQEAYWFVQEGSAIAVMHGTPWAYDTHVPVIFAGLTITSKTVHRRVHPVAVAPTIAALLGLKPPSAALSGPLPEVLR